MTTKGDITEFDGLKSYLPGFKKLSYSWDFGDHIRSSGERVNHSYLKKGDYTVNLCLTLKSESTGNIRKTGISKKITVLNDYQEKASYLAKEPSEKPDFLELKDAENVKMTNLYSAENECQQDAVFVVELVTSKNRMDLNKAFFRNVPKKFSITEEPYQDTIKYCYNVDQQMSLMATYPAYREMMALGYKEARVKMFLLKDQPEKELLNLIKINGAYADSYFDSKEKLTSSAYIMLDQVFKLMKKYPPLKLELAVHTDNRGPADKNLALSQRHSQYMVNYLIKKRNKYKKNDLYGIWRFKTNSTKFSGERQKT